MFTIIDIASVLGSENKCAAGWVTYSDLSLYVRKTNRIFPSSDGFIKTVEVANVISNFKSESNKRWSDYINKLPKLFDHFEKIVQEYGYEAIYCENVINQRVAKIIERRGYNKIILPYNFHGEEIFCFYHIFN